MQLIVSTNPLTGFSAYIDQVTGEAYISDTLICSLTGIHHQTLDKIIQSETVRDFASEATQILRQTGFVTVRGLRKSTDISTILFAWKPTSEVNKERKEKLIKSLVDAGTTAYVYSLCGYSMQSKIAEPSINPALLVAREYAEIQSLVEDNPRLAQILIDSTINFHIGDQFAIAPSQSVPLIGVVEIAHSEGFKTDLSSRVKLGIFVKGIIGHLAQSEQRLVNGTWQKVNCYPDCEEVRNAVRSFFN